MAARPDTPRIPDALAGAGHAWGVAVVVEDAKERRGGFFKPWGRRAVEDLEVAFAAVDVIRIRSRNHVRSARARPVGLIGHVVSAVVGIIDVVIVEAQRFWIRGIVRSGFRGSSHGRRVEDEELILGLLL